MLTQVTYVVFNFAMYSPHVSVHRLWMKKGFVTNITILILYFVVDCPLVDLNFTLFTWNISTCVTSEVFDIWWGTLLKIDSRDGFSFACQCIVYSCFPVSLCDIWRFFFFILKIYLGQEDATFFYIEMSVLLVLQYSAFRSKVQPTEVTTVRFWLRSAISLIHFTEWFDISMLWAQVSIYSNT